MCKVCIINPVESKSLLLNVIDARLMMFQVDEMFGFLPEDKPATTESSMTPSAFKVNCYRI